MTQKLDMRGQKCPQPVIETKKALEAMEAGMLEVIVDNDAARQNILRFATFKQLHAESSSEKEEEYTITITKGEAGDGPHDEQTPAPDPEVVCEEGGERVVLITSARIGDDNDALGRELMSTFLDVLTQATRVPDRMVFINAGVTLTTEGSPVLDALQQLETVGVKIASCGRCLEYLHLKEKLKVGQVTNMYEIIENLTSARSVIKL
ncbi:MAG: sulfurtransferase-like selenium metabolism protein YedF [Planctomycetes bacterium]|nr:sulfurtransferase-like selenium metabolism protein YedF [Planctomycetota bacterium]